MFRGNRRPRRGGFTLIELLVVIAIISLLISILLPSLTGARRTGQRVACMAKLRSLSSGATEYATDNDDWIIGSPSGSGAYVVNDGVAWGAAVQDWDFMGPMAAMWALELPKGDRGNQQGVINRFNALRGQAEFLCPSNGFLSGWFGGPNAGVNRMVSYNTVRTQLFRSEPEPGGPPPIVGVTIMAGNFEEKLPPKWRPSLNKMGNPANKVFCADGARFSTSSIAPDYDLTPLAGWGGAFSDSGAFSPWTRSWDRGWAPGNSRQGSVDGRVYAYRHSTAEPPQGAPGNAFKLNVAFYDGHVDTQGDLESSNPYQWLPMGSRVDPTGGGVWPDTVAHFRLGGAIDHIGP